MAEDEAKSRGNSAFSAGNFSEAITHFTEAINISPNNHLLYSNRSAAYASLSNYSQALTDAQKTVELKPEWSKGYSRLGSAYTGLKNYSQAVSAYEKGLEIDPDNDFLKSKMTLAKAQKQIELKEAFNTTKSTQQLLSTFEEMVTCFDEKALATECFALLEALIAENRVNDARLLGAKVSRLILGDNNKCSSGNVCFLDDNSMFLHAKVCNYFGSSCVEAKHYDEGLRYLNMANWTLNRFQENENSVCDGKCVLCALAFNEYFLHRVKMFKGEVMESALHAKKSLEIRENLLEEGCHGLAMANKDVFYAYGSGMMFKEAIPFGWKALEIQMRNSGSDSLEVAKLRDNLAYMYHELGEHEKGCELEELARIVLKTRESPDDMIREGRYEEAVRVLEGSVLRADLKEEERVLDYMSMASAFYKMGKYSDAKKHLRTGQEILENRPGMFNPSLVAMVLLGNSGLYEKMTDTEAAVSLVKRVLAMPDLPRNLFPRAASRFLSLVPESGKAKEEIPEMLNLVEKLKVIFGPEHCDVGYGYGNLGVAYWNSNQQDLAVKFLEDAKSILDATIGPNHVDSLKTSHDLSVFYGKIGRYTQALEIEKKVVEGLKGLAPSELGFVHDNKHLSIMKVSVAESLTTASFQSKDGGISAMISKCDISNDGKGTT